ncbi:glucuronyl esterase domain-containing protein [Algoriphagus persicinus]|uniref:glucuronyl esterase domain-containing protein n=1 Tax=Algoriphagus persicinus TaxID=3108754 RepID=UPI002B3904F1|nr:acetylxylan esterase [Algoriphagus sp. E1-3-M2]MEB2784453.1 acetylxylan esterase [Algoriphagus sp. E1-3-M2]
MKKFLILSFILLLSLNLTLMAQHVVNEDENKVPPLVLPDPFVSEKGLLIKSVAGWESIRKPELIKLFTEEVYGPIPIDYDEISFKEVSENANPFPEITIFKELDITVSRNGNSHTMRLNVFLPKSALSPVPVALLINHRPAYTGGTIVEEGFWPVEELINRGYATASFHGETVAPDDADKFSEGVISSLYPEELSKPDGMRTFGAWGWAAMRAMDYFEQESKIDSKKSALIGHSRAGKTALWTGVNDNRWAIVMPNESGCGGAAISRRKFGETIKIINTSFPHWFNDNFKKYNDNENSLPIDQHMLAMLIAPRAIYYSSAREDLWADPKGEYLSMKLGSRVYTEIYGMSVSFPLEFENLEDPIIQNHAGYHIRNGQHSLTLEDWKHYMDFMELNFQNKN